MDRHEVRGWGLPRAEDEVYNDTPDYGNNPDYFTMKIHHGGCIKNGKYIGPDFIGVFDWVNKENMFMLEICDMVKQVNSAYTDEVMGFFYKVGDENVEANFVILKSDKDVLTMCSVVPTRRVIRLYLDLYEVKRRMEPTIEDLYMYEEFLFGEDCVIKSTCVIEELPDEDTSAVQKGKRKIIENEGAEHGGASHGGASHEEVEHGGAEHGGAEHAVKKGKRKIIENEGAEHGGASHGGASHGEVEHGGAEHGGAEHVGAADHGGAEHVEADHGADGGADHRGAEHVGADHGADGGADHKGAEKTIRVEDELTIDYLDHLQSYGIEPNVSGRSSEDEEDSDYHPKFNEDGYGTNEEERGEELGYLSGEENIRHLNDEGEITEQEIMFNPNTDMVHPIRFCLGMRFPNVQVCRDALRELAIQGGWEFRYLRSEPGRVRAICKEPGCEFNFFASKMQHVDDLMIKGLNMQHKCVRKFNNKMVSQQYLTKKFKDHIAMNPNQKPGDLASQMSKELKVAVSKVLAYRAKKAAIKEIEGSIKEQYGRLIDYGTELQRVDPETTVNIKCEFEDSIPTFKRMYICLGALKKGFKAGCRSLIGLDGAHLKTCFGGQLLVAVGIDANNTSWVVAYALVEMENKDAWIWFLELLCADLEINNAGKGWIFISDKQKGLIQAFDHVVPSAMIRFCARHLYTNFQKKFSRIDLKKAMWACARATTLPHHESAMEDLKNLKSEAYDWLKDPERPAKHWCRAFFPGGYDTDMHINNACESFNGWILEARSKPPITMLEDIRVKLMGRIRIRKEKMDACHDHICPNIRKILEINKDGAASSCTPIFNGELKAEVDNGSGKKFAVDVGQRSCSCRRWDLTGIPCMHAVSAINGLRLEPDDYVSACYTTETYMKTYNNFIQPCNSMDLWSKSDGVMIQPPKYTRQPGRARTKMTKDWSERIENGAAKLGRVQRSLNCGNCGQEGHNIKTCRSHLPPKNAAASRTKRKAVGEPSQTQTKSKKKALLSADELREIASQKAKNAREKMAARRAAKRAEKLDANRPTRGRPPTRDLGGSA